jgi:type VI secretion system protein ImpA
MPWRDDLLVPISGGNPSGSNLRYDPVTEAIKEARREDLALTQGAWKTALKTADFRQVIRLAGDALAKRSKDLQIAAWLMDAHVRVDGFAALAPGFVLLRNLLDQFWDTLYPEIEEGDLELRAAPLDWLGSKLEYPLTMLPLTSSGLSFATYKQSRLIGYEQDAVSDERQSVRQRAIKEGKATAEEFDEAVNATPREFYEDCQKSLASAIQELQALSDLCDEKFGDSAPSFLKTRMAIENIAQQVRIFLGTKPAIETAPAVSTTPAVIEPVPVVVAAAVPVAIEPVAAAAPAPSPAAAPAANPASPPLGLSDVIARIGLICRYLRESTIYDASAFLVIRALRWGELRAKAPNIEPPMLIGPPPELRVQLKECFAARDWGGVVNLTESAMELPCGRAWLDLQRYTVQALERQGEYYERVALSVRGALRALLEELPGLVEQTLTDDTPAANPETRIWIEEQILAGAPAKVPAANVPAIVAEAPPAPLPVPVQVALESRPPEIEPDEDAAAPDPFEAALEAARANRPAEAVELISRQLASERSGRGRFRRRTQLAHLLVSAGHKGIALPILERLVGEIEQRRLEDWEPGEALAYPVDLLLRCLDANGADANERKALYARLCQLDPARALKSAPV